MIRNHAVKTDAFSLNMNIMRGFYFLNLFQFPSPKCMCITWMGARKSAKESLSLSSSLPFLPSSPLPFLSTRHMNCLDVYFGWCLGKWFRMLSAILARGAKFDPHNSHKISKQTNQVWWCVHVTLGLGRQRKVNPQSLLTRSWQTSDPVRDLLSKLRCLVLEEWQLRLSWPPSTCMFIPHMHVYQTHT